MHEVSVMMSIMDTVSNAAKEENAEKVTKISLLIGKKSGVMVDSLRFAFDMVAADTVAKGAELEIEEVPFRGQCQSCGHEFTSEDFLVCDECGGFAKILSGQELSIKSIEVE